MNAQLHSECAGRLWAMMREPLLAILRAVRSDAPLVKPQAAVGGMIGRAGAVAVIPIRGTIMPTDSFLLEFFGGTSIERFRKNFRDALADDSVSGILLKIDSPGGAVDMVASMADEIYAARGKKPITAYTETMTASAAYWLGSQADQFMAARDAEIGSIGVFCEHVSIAGALEQQGVVVTLITAGEHKAEASPYESLSDDARAHIQKRVNEVNSDFRAAVARGRGVTPSAVDENYGQGLVFGAKEAAKLGMIDKVATLDQAMAMVVAGSRRRALAAGSSDTGVIHVSDDSVDMTAAEVSNTGTVVFVVEGDPTEVDGSASEREAEADGDRATATLALLERS